jgi:alanine dehydrogenase
MESTSVLQLTSEEVDGLVEPATFVDVVREGYRERGMGAPAAPRTALCGDDPPGLLTGYLAILPEKRVMGGYTYAAGFGERDAHFVLQLFDAESGRLLALIDGASINPYKTGATGAVGVDALARPDATDLAIFGSGPQARGQLQAIATVRDLGTVRVYSPTPAHRADFATEFDDRLDAAVRAVDTPDAAVADADVVVTVTDSKTPVFDGEALADGAHVNAIGQYHPEHYEVDPTTVARATYVPDLAARVGQDAGAFMNARDRGVIDDDHVHAELGEVVAGERPGRTDADEVTMFDSGGTAIETVAAGYEVYHRAREAGRGREIEFSPGSVALTGG